LASRTLAFLPLNAQKSSGRVMLMSAAAECLTLLTWHREHRPENTFCSVDDLDEILNGHNRDKHMEYLADNLPIFPYINWWVDVFEALSVGRSTEGGSHANPAFNQQRDKLFALLNDVVSMYTAALCESLYYSGVHRPDTYPSQLELLQRYRRFTLHVCHIAQEMWPDVDLEWLLRQA
jgi:hypothetical protein